MELEYKNDNSNYKKILDVLKLEFSMSDRLILKLKKNNKIYLNGDLCYAWTPISIGDIVKASIDFDEDNSNIYPTPIALDILYEDDCLLIVNKPPHMPCSSFKFTLFR